jgi:AcrR family transcriptional regulator
VAPKPGRPPTPGATKPAILQTALAMIDAGHGNALTFRSLATAFGVTPMAIAHHVGSRDQLLADLITLSFASLVPAATGPTPQDRLRDLLTRYAQSALRHPNLITLVFANPALLTGPLLGLTDRVRAELATLPGPPAVLLNLTIDYTHGFALSAAAAPPGGGPSLDDYLAGLNWILSHGFPDNQPQTPSP